MKNKRDQSTPAGKANAFSLRRICSPKIFGIILKSFVLINFAPSLAGAEVRPSLGAVTMNIRCFDGDWRFRLGHILNKFIEISPDVIALQEVCIDPNSGESQIDFIKDYLQSHGYLFEGIDTQYTHQAWGRFDEYIVLISKLKIVGVDKGLLPASLLQRGFIAFNIDHIWYVNTHLEYRADNAESRRKQIDFLRHRFSGRPHFICGDFNSSPEAPEQRGFQDAGYLAIFPSDSQPLDDGNASKKIDGFWLSPEFAQKLEKLSADVILNQKVQGEYLSDHFAIFAKFWLRPVTR